MANRQETIVTSNPDINEGILPFAGPTSDFDLAAANKLLLPLSATERIEWASNRFRLGLVALTSAGLDSALVVHHIAEINRRGHSIPVWHFDTGLLHPETLSHEESLQELLDSPIHKFGPMREQTRDIIDNRLWETDLPEYRLRTKLIPLQRAIGAFGVTALISGIRRDQQTNTEHRAKKDIIGWGLNGELRIHPFIDWPKEAVDLYIDSNNLPKHPLHGSYDSIDDWPLMGLGQIKTECGMHLNGEDMIERAS